MVEQNIYEKLRKVQQELHVPKSQRNSFGNYNYRSAEDILEAVKSVLDKHGLALTISDEMVHAGDRYYIKATATVYPTDLAGYAGGNPLSSTAYAREDETKKGMDGAQITGAASSYARKYALNGLFAIDDTKDADTDEHTSQRRTEAPKRLVQPTKPLTQPATASAVDKRRIAAYLTAKGVSGHDMPGVLTEDYKVADPHNMTADEAQRVLKELER